jgi:hypothetical protein
VMLAEVPSNVDFAQDATSRGEGDPVPCVNCTPAWVRGMADLETMAILLRGVAVAHLRHQVNVASLQSAVGAP